MFRSHLIFEKKSIFNQFLFNNNNKSNKLKRENFFELLQKYLVNNLHCLFSINFE